MTLPHEDLPRVDGRLLDRLVDGELSDAERSALLARLEAEPDGWRRCALAFLEARAWREAFAPLAARTSRDAMLPPVDAPSGIPADVPRPGSRTWPPSRRLRTFAAIAAGFLAAFVAGWSAGEMSHARVPGRNVAQGPSPRDANGPAPRAGSGPEEDTPAPGSPEAPRPPIDHRWLAQLPTPLPESVLRQLERSGYQVDQQQVLISMGLDDGDSVALPVNEVNVRYVGDRTY